MLMDGNFAVVLAGVRFGDGGVICSVVDAERSALGPPLRVVERVLVAMM